MTSTSNHHIPCLSKPSSCSCSCYLWRVNYDAHLKSFTQTTFHKQQTFQHRSHTWALPNTSEGKEQHCSKLYHISHTSSLVRNLSEHGANFLYCLVLCLRNLLVHKQNKQGQQNGEDDEHISTQSFLQWQRKMWNRYSCLNKWICYWVWNKNMTISKPLFSQFGGMYEKQKLWRTGNWMPFHICFFIQLCLTNSLLSVQYVPLIVIRN